MNIGDTISSIRKEKNMTQEELAKKLNVSAKTISSWENNRNLPSIDMIILLSEALDTDINTLLDINKSNVTEKSNAYKKKDFKDQLLKIIFIGLIFIVPILFFWYAGYSSITAFFSMILSSRETFEINDIFHITRVIMTYFNTFVIKYFIYLLIVLLNYILYKKKYFKILLGLNTLILFYISLSNYDIFILLAPIIVIPIIILGFLKSSKIYYNFNIILSIICLISFIVLFIDNIMGLGLTSHLDLDLTIFIIAGIIGMYWAYKIKD